MAAGLIETVALLIALSVVAMRPLISETYESSMHSIAAAVGLAADLTPAATAWLDLAVWIAAGLAALGALVSSRRWRWGGLAPGALVLLGAAIASTLAAGNQRVALNASVNWLTSILIALVVLNLCRTRLRVSLMLAVIIASGLATSAKSLMQVAVEFPETRAHYDETKLDFWHGQGIALDAPQVELYERRLDAREASGFFPHSNVAGSWLLLSAFAALAAMSILPRLSVPWIVLLIVSLILFASILTTRSTAAIAAAVVGILVWIGLRDLQTRLRHRWRTAWLGGWLLIGVAVIGVVLFAFSRGGLPGDSLRFRWNYWQVAYEIVQQSPWTGTGALNFDRAYLALKPVRFPEEIRDPHNFLVSITAQWGIGGGVGLLLLLLLGSYRMAWLWGRASQWNRIAPYSDAGNGRPTTNPSPRSRLIAWTIGIVAAFIQLRLWVLRDWFDEPTGSAIVFFDLGAYGLVWIISFAGVLWATQRPVFTNEPQRDKLYQWDDGYRLSCLCGVAAFLLAESIGFGLFYPGSLTPFAAMIGLLLARPVSAELDHASRARSGVAVAASGIGVVVVLLLHVIPVTRSTSLLEAAREGTALPAETYWRAADADPLDPTPLMELAQWHANTMTLESLNDSLSTLREAIARDPRKVALHRMRGRLQELRYHASGSEADLVAAVGSARKALSLYPHDPDMHADLADQLVRIARLADSSEARFEARQHYRIGLRLDAQRAPGEIRRWSKRKRNEVVRKLLDLQEYPEVPPAGGMEN
jgi:O-antigen ligase